MRLFNFVTLVLFPTLLCAQQIQNTSYTTSRGERVLRFEFVIPISKQAAWELFTTEEGLKKWLAPVVSIDFKIGGYRLTNYNEAASTSDSGTIRTKIVNYLEGELITHKINLNEKFTAKVRREDENLQEIICFVALNNQSTKIIDSMIGWGVGPDWDKTYEFFARGNKWTAERITKLFR